MFETLLPSPASARRRRIRNAIIGTSVAAHGALAVGLIVLGMWKVEKLEAERSTLSVSVLTPPGDSGGGGAPKQAAPVAGKKPPKVVARDLTQPDLQPDKDEPEPDVAVEDRSGEGGGDASGPPGNGTGGDGQGIGVPTVGTGCLAPPCGTDTTDLPPPAATEQPPEKPEPVSIPPTAAKRISGDPQIAAPDAVKAEMLHMGKRQTLGGVKLCIGADGKVDRAQVVTSTGYAAYDQKLLREMRTWRYRPYTVNGEATAACFMVQLVYRIND